MNTAELCVNLTEDSARERISELTLRATAISQEIDDRRDIFRQGKVTEEEFYPWMRRAMSARNQARADVKMLNRWLGACIARRKVRTPAPRQEDQSSSERQELSTWTMPDSAGHAMEQRSVLVAERMRLDVLPTTPEIQGQREAIAERLTRINRWIKERNIEINNKYPDHAQVCRGLLSIIDRLSAAGSVLTKAEHSLCGGAAEFCEWVETQRRWRREKT